MKKILLPFIGLFALILSTQAQSKKEMKDAKRTEMYDMVVKLVESKAIVFNVQDVTTQKGRKINVNGEGHTLTINDANSVASLPYFGVAQVTTYGATDNGINFDAEMKNFKVKRNDKKRKITINYTCTANNEKYTLTLYLGSSEYATLNISSSSRNNISYYGTIAAFEK